MIRIGTVQVARRIVDHRLPPAEALAQVERHLDELEGVVHRAGKAGCDAFCLPEDTLGIWNWEAANKQARPELLPRAVPRMLERLGSAAGAHRMYLVCCSDTIEPDGAATNTAFFLGRDGKEIGRYQKVNHPIHDLDKKRGENFPVFETPELGGVGMLICYDMVFPEAARCLALGGADIIFNPTLGGGAAIGGAEISRAAYRTRAVENFVYIVVAERGAGAMILSPKGEVLVEAEGADGFAIADIDPFGGREGGDAMNWQRDMRARLFRERTPAAFGILSDPEPPALRKLPETISVDEAVRIAGKTLSTGDARFQEAEALQKAGKIPEAIRAFEQLCAEFPQTWVDRQSRRRLAALREESPENQVRT
jgi:predicted amidohydrolase